MQNSYSFEGTWGGRKGRLENCIEQINPFTQFSENAAECFVDFSCKDAFSDSPVKLKFLFHQDLNSKKWILTKIEPIQGVGSQGFSTFIRKHQSINYSIEEALNVQAQIEELREKEKSESQEINNKNQGKSTPPSQAQTKSLEQSHGSSVKYRTWVSGLRVRSSPDKKAEIVGKLETNSSVTILDKSDKAEWIELRKTEYIEPWYKIRAVNGTEGWIFGGGIELVNNGQKVKDPYVGYYSTGRMYCMGISRMKGTRDKYAVCIFYCEQGGDNVFEGSLNDGKLLVPDLGAEITFDGSANAEVRKKKPGVYYDEGRYQKYKSY